MELVNGYTAFPPHPSPLPLRGGEGGAHLRELNLLLEQLRVLWRLVQERRWISQQQLLFANGRLDEIGRMTGGWLKQVERNPRTSESEREPHMKARQGGRE